MDNIYKNCIRELLSSHVGLVGIWRGSKLKNAGRKNQHHYRRNGRLYVVYRNKYGEYEHILSEIYYKTIKNSSSPLSNKVSKNANPSQKLRLDRDFLAYQEYKNK